MKRDYIDFFTVPEHQLAIHARLENWARYVTPRRSPWLQHPMWRQGKSNGRQWELPVVRDAVNTLDGHELEKAVGALPDLNRDALRWNYVGRQRPTRISRLLGVSLDTLHQAVIDGRQMLINRRV